MYRSNGYFVTGLIDGIESRHEQDNPVVSEPEREPYHPKRQ